MTNEDSGFGQLGVNPLSEQNADKTERREERYSLALRVANDGLWEWDLEKNEISYSAKWKSMIGFQDDEIGQSPNEWFERIHPEDHDRVEALINAYLDVVPSNFEIEYRISLIKVIYPIFNLKIRCGTI